MGGADLQNKANPTRIGRPRRHGTEALPYLRLPGEIAAATARSGSTRKPW